MLSHIEESRSAESVFKLSALTQLYKTRLVQLGLNVEGRIHLTHLKDKILAHFPALQAHKNGREILLAFNEDIASALKEVYERNCDDEAIILAQAASICRREMNNLTCTFKGNFEAGCQKSSVSSTLLCLVSMILRGPNIQNYVENVAETQTALSIAELLHYNVTFRRPDRQVNLNYHSTSRGHLYQYILVFSYMQKQEKRVLLRHYQNLDYQ